MDGKRLRQHACLIFALVAGLAHAAVAADELVFPGDDLTSASGLNVNLAPPTGFALTVLDDQSLIRVAGEWLWREWPDGRLTLYAPAPVPTARAAWDPVGQRLAVVSGALFSEWSLWLVEDLDGDGDALDPGESGPWPQPLDGVVGPGFQPFAASFDPIDGALYVTGPTTGPFTVPPEEGVVLRVDDQDASLFSEGATGPIVARDGVVFVGQTLFAVLPTLPLARILRYADLDGDGDALDPEETALHFEGEGTVEAMTEAADGSLYTSSRFGEPAFPFWPSCIDRVLPDADGDGAADGVERCAVCCVFLSFPDKLALRQGPGGFVPGVDGDGVLYFADLFFEREFQVATAPFATTTVLGDVLAGTHVDVVVGGAPGAAGQVLVSLDPSEAPWAGVGQLGLGFGAPWFATALQPLGPNGQTTFTFAVRDLPGESGDVLAVQGVTYEGAEIGLGDPVELVVGGGSP